MCLIVSKSHIIRSERLWYQMMYLSSKGVKTMNVDEKQKSLKKTIISIKERLDLDGKKNSNDVELDNKVNEFINSL